MADKLISQGTIMKIWAKSIIDNTKSLEYLKSERGFTESMIEGLEVGYIDYYKFGESFFLKDVIVFPLYDASGKLKGLNTRKLYDKFFIKFVCSNYPLIYSDYEFVNKTLVLVESPICALTLRTFLPDMSVASSLSAAISVQHLIMYGTAKKIITVMDDDDAGARSADSISAYNPNTYVVPRHYYADCKDPNAIYKEDFDSFETLVAYIKNIDRRTK